MKLVNRKTRKAIKKSIRKAIENHGPTLIAALASGVAASIATLAKTESPDTRGKSNLADLVDGAKQSVLADGQTKPRPRDSEREPAFQPADDLEGTSRPRRGVS